MNKISNELHPLIIDGKEIWTDVPQDYNMLKYRMSKQKVVEDLIKKQKRVRQNNRNRFFG